MANIIIKKGDYTNESAIYNEINYALSSEYYKYSGAAGLLWYPSLRQCCTDIVLGANDIDPNIESMTGAFKTVKSAYGKTDGNQILHLIVAFRREDCMTPILANIFAAQLAEYIGQRFQVVYGIHMGSVYNSGYLHVHFVINTVSYIDGNRLYDKNTYYYDICNVAKTFSPDLRWNVYVDCK